MSKALTDYLSDRELVETGVVRTPSEAKALRRRRQNGTWDEGVSGNPAGRAKGSRNQATLLRQRFVEAKAKDVLDLAFGHAINNPTAAIWLAERIFGTKDWAASPLPFEGPLDTPEACTAALDALLDALLSGALEQTQFDRMAHLIDRRREMLAAAERQGRCA